MKRSIIAIGVLCAAALPLAAQAADHPESGWYLGVTGGVSSYGNSSDDERNLQSELAQEGIQSTVTVDDNATAWGVGGGYQFNRYAAVELNYVDLGNATADIFVTSPAVVTLHETNRAKGETLDVIGMFPVSQMVSIFVKGGLFNYKLEQTLSADVAIPAESVSATGTTFDIGVGVDLRFTDTWGLRAGFTQYHGVGDDNTTGKSNIGLAYAQLVLHF